MSVLCHWLSSYTTSSNANSSISCVRSGKYRFLCDTLQLLCLLKKKKKNAEINFIVKYLNDVGISMPCYEFASLACCSSYLLNCSINQHLGKPVMVNCGNPNVVLVLWPGIMYSRPPQTQGPRVQGWAMRHSNFSLHPYLPLHHHSSPF